MTAILGVFNREQHPADERLVRRMLARAGRRGAIRAAVWREGGAALAVGRQDWELGPGFSGPVLVVQDDDCVVAADASLYYRDDLRRALAGKGVRAHGHTASHLILATYRAWGERCAEHLEGDFAFVLWDRSARRMVCARDFGGKRPLFYAEIESQRTLIVASTINALLDHPHCSDELNLAVVAETMASFVGSGGSTCYRAVSRLDAGYTLVRERGFPVRTRRHWDPPVFESSSNVSLDRAADELRELLRRSVVERLAPAGPTGVWLSGGRDSTAVFAAGQCLRQNGPSRQELCPVSVSYPPGDPGREDELIDAVAARWQRPVRWVRIDDIPLLDRPAERSAERDEPFAHLYEMWNRTLARESRQLGAHVALDGIGGDQLFHVSSVFLADLLLTGRWVSLAREWRVRGMTGSGFRTFFRWAVQPALSPSLLRLAQFMRNGRPLRAELRRRTPEWIDEDFARRHELTEYVNVTPQRRRGESVGAMETRWYLTDPYFPTVFGLIASFALEEGLEVRSPLYDRRIIELAATRPRAERASGTQTKLLLRSAMRGLLPEHVLGPRAMRTGVTSLYFDRSLRGTYGAMLTEELRAPVLAELGVVDPTALQRACDRYMRSGHDELGLRLFLTLQTELWLRAHVRSATEASSPAFGALAAVV